MGKNKRQRRNARKRREERELALREAKKRAQEETALQKLSGNDNQSDLEEKTKGGMPWYAKAAAALFVTAAIGGGIVAGHMSGAFASITNQNKYEKPNQAQVTDASQKMRLAESNSYKLLTRVSTSAHDDLSKYILMDEITGDIPFLFEERQFSDALEKRLQTTALQPKYDRLREIIFSWEGDSNPLQVPSVTRSKLMQPAEHDQDVIDKSRYLLEHAARFFDMPGLKNFTLSFPSTEDDIQTGRHIYFGKSFGSFIIPEAAKIEDYSGKIPLGTELKRGLGLWSRRLDHSTGLYDHLFISIATQRLQPTPEYRRNWSDTLKKSVDIERKIAANGYFLPTVVEAYHAERDLALFNDASTSYFEEHGYSHPVVRDPGFSNLVAENLWHTEIADHAAYAIWMSVLSLERPDIIPPEYPELYAKDLEETEPTYIGCFDLFKKMKLEMKPGESLDHFSKRQNERVNEVLDNFVGPTYGTKG